MTPAFKTSKAALKPHQTTRAEMVVILFRSSEGLEFLAGTLYLAQHLKLVGYLQLHFVA